VQGWKSCHLTGEETDMSDEAQAADADRTLKDKHRAMWCLGDYPAVASDVIPGLGPVLVRACGVRAGDRVLDVAAATGNAAFAAAQAGATVVASDLAPELLDHGRALGEERGVDIEWRVADAENLPFADDEFDVVMSCVGVMFAPHHQASADELVRVCRPGGTIGLVSWTPEGFIGQMFAVMMPYAAPPPAGAQPPPLWGDEDHVRELLGDRVTDLVTTRQDLRVDRFERPEDFRDFFKACYGPTIAAYQRNSGDPDKVAALDRELAELPRAFGHGDGTNAMDWEYLLVTARKRS
jgi:SAM-dependent methyltransferase